MLAGLNCKIWVDNIVWWGADDNNLLNTLDKILGCLEDAGLFAAAHKCLFFDTEVSWCGKVYSRGQVSHDRERSSGLASMRRPQTAGELMQVLQAVNWLRTPLPRLVEVVEFLRVLLEEPMGEFSAGPSESRRIGRSRRKHGSASRWLRGAMLMTWWPTPSLCRTRRTGMRC